MLGQQHRHSISYHEETRPRPSRWGSLANEHAFIDLLEHDHAQVQPLTLTLAPINSNIYARRHSSHNCQSTVENNVSPIPPPVPLRRPAVPQRSGSVNSKEITNTELRPPPLPPTPKNRALPASLRNHVKPQPPPRGLRFSSSNSQNSPKSATKQPASYSDVFDFVGQSAPIQSRNSNVPVGQPPPSVTKTYEKSNGPSPLPRNMSNQPHNSKSLTRQEVSVSSDSQTSSPSYTVKNMDAPLIPSKPRHQNGILNKLQVNYGSDSAMNSLTKSASTPASLQAIVRFHHGSNMSLHHKIIKDMRRPSSISVGRVKLRFQFAQILLNAIALLAIGGGMAAYLKETKKRCGFFLDVFGLALPDYLECDLFPESNDPEICVGHREVQEAKERAKMPLCDSGFSCDFKRCIPKEWQCDGHIDCKDQSDELNCHKCNPGMIHCGNDKCMAQEQMCDGKVDCPMGQDERNCLRLSERNGDEGRGQLEIFRPELQKWIPACITHWDQNTSPSNICSLLGYSSVNSSRILKGITNIDFSDPSQETTTLLRTHRNKRSKNLLREFSSCNGTSYPTVDITCTNFLCGKTRKSYAERRSLRIIGGVKSRPGDWPFLAALLGGPEEIFYCAGVLIADQWVLTASHCVGNHSDVSGWTIQLGITRRHAHSYYGQKMKVQRVVPHPMYNVGVAHDNDVALFQLASRVTFHEHLLPVCLPPPNKELLPGTKCTVIGWGKKEDRGMSEYEPEINEVEVPVLNRELCNTWLESRDLNVTDGMICAGYKEGGKDACQGDSGGPLLCKDADDPERWFVGGIVSWGIKCAHPHLPGVYAYVPKYIPWILKQMATYSD